MHFLEVQLHLERSLADRRWFVRSADCATVATATAIAIAMTVAAGRHYKVGPGRTIGRNNNKYCYYYYHYYYCTGTSGVRHAFGGGRAGAGRGGRVGRGGRGAEIRGT